MMATSALDEVLSNLLALSRIETLELAPLERALGGTAREVGPDANIVHGHNSSFWTFDGPSAAFSERRFEIRGAGPDPFIVLQLRLTDGVRLLPPDVEPTLAELPFSFRPDHASFSDGPRLTGISYQFSVPAGTLWLTFDDVALERFGGANISRKLDQVLDGAPSANALARIVLNNTRSKLDASFTIARMRQWARSGEPWKG